MATSSMTETSTQPVNLTLETAPTWLKELRTRGWTIVPNTISKEKAAYYAEQCYDWLESWQLGFDRNDKATRRESNVPWYIRGGLYARYGIAHEQFVWDLKCEPGLIEKFSQIWGTDELAVSYDGLNLSVPEAAREPTDPIFAPWAHVDQSPYRTNLQCVQGVLNLLPNGPDDGGLTVLEGSNALYTQLWKHFDHKKGENGWNKFEQQYLDQEMSEWLEKQGCKWTKVCAEPGDLLLWDSRTVHYGSFPSSTNDRFAAYVCYKPAAFVSEEVREQRLNAFAAKQGTARDPTIIRLTARLPPDDHPSYEAAVKRPLQDPKISRRARQLASLDLY